MSIGDRVKNAFKTWLNIQPAAPSGITVVEPYSYDTNVYRNRFWYRGEPAELQQFAMGTDDGIGNVSFWASRSSHGLDFRKIHAGLPALIVDVLADIVENDFSEITIDNTEAQKRWDAIAKENNFKELLRDAIKNTLVDGDGSWKVSYDKTISDLPIIEYFSGPSVRYEYTRGRLVAIHFETKYPVKNSQSRWYTLDEVYGIHGITYTLYDDTGETVELSHIPDLGDLSDVTYAAKKMLAVQMLMTRSTKWRGRGKSLLESKAGSFDALDEIVSQWVEALRAGRTTKYIPENLLPKNSRTGEVIKSNPFDNKYIAIPPDMREDAKNQIQIVSGEIPTEALLSGYMSMLDLCLQGIMSPSTLGIDVKKLDNADAQREKEKATLYTRNKIISMLEDAIPAVVQAALSLEDIVHNKMPDIEYPASISFGEYANPSFEAQVETVGKARQYQIMSMERCVDELYGDSLTADEKSMEVNRLKAEAGIVSLDDGSEQDNLLKLRLSNPQAPAPGGQV